MKEMKILTEFLNKALAMNIIATTDIISYGTYGYSNMEIVHEVLTEAKTTTKPYLTLCDIACDLCHGDV